MHVGLINYSTNPYEFDGELAASMCVNKEPSSKGFQSALKSGHLAVTEFLPLTFKVEGISRACLAQLTRHRHVSFCVESQRYCKVNTDKLWYVTPELLANNELFHNTMDIIADAYTKLIESGVRKEDARMVLPNACSTNLVMSMNAREFIHICNLRLCSRAQAEIRELFAQCKDRIKLIYPSIYKLCVPNCMTSVGCQEEHPCHNPNGYM